MVKIIAAELNPNKNLDEIVLKIHHLTQQQKDLLLKIVEENHDENTFPTLEQLQVIKQNIKSEDEKLAFEVYEVIGFLTKEEAAVVQEKQREIFGKEN